MEIAALASFAVLLASWVVAPSKTSMTEESKVDAAPSIVLEPTPTS